MTRKEHFLTTPATDAAVTAINAGDIVYLSGIIYTARDEAHHRILEYAHEKKQLPFDLKGAAIFHCGPVMKKEGTEWKAIAAGPTTSDRMTKMTPDVLKNHDIKILIGKGGMENLSTTMAERNCVYLSYTGGCAALAVDMIKNVRGVHWEDLGMPEAVWELEVEKFGPLIAGIDAHGNDLFQNVLEKANAVFEDMKCGRQIL
ncbi:MAG: FumA C-terminus/TtdB family hydratase beta subunit [Methanimicrococcus sp.]|nr:FumA C-terminus/TtdB family hydratase beta subunit [Methanimicrococcus sp.]